MKTEQYPIGKFDNGSPADAAARTKYIRVLEELPALLSGAVEYLDDFQLDTTYRKGGWKIRQVVHHIADSHINSFCRFKLALTQEKPTICPYSEVLWAELDDSKIAPTASLNLIEGLHNRWVSLLRGMSDSDFERELFHPESGNTNLGKMLSYYDWHSRHHLAHITNTIKRENW
ncbi:MAG: YfiT family bacillithiol transferase [Pyrinomonadaceae bacterium]